MKKLFNIVIIFFLIFIAKPSFSRTYCLTLTTGSQVKARGLKRCDNGMLLYVSRLPIGMPYTQFNEILERVDGEYFHKDISEIPLGEEECMAAYLPRTRETDVIFIESPCD